MRVAVLIVAISIGSMAGWFGYLNPEAVVRVSGTASTLLAVLVAVSMSIFAVLSTDPNIESEDRQASTRLKVLVAREDEALTDQQLSIFFVFLTALALNFFVQFLLVGPFSSETEVWKRALSASAAATTSSSLVLSFLLPSSLVGIIRRNKRI